MANTFATALEPSRYTEDEGGCRLWGGSTYTITVDGVRMDPHVAAWLAHNAFRELPLTDKGEGTDLHHLCGQSRCVNPDHLVLITKSGAEL